MEWVIIYIISFIGVIGLSVYDYLKHSSDYNYYTGHIGISVAAFIPLLNTLILALVLIAVLGQSLVSLIVYFIKGRKRE